MKTLQTLLLLISLYFSAYSQKEMDGIAYAKYTIKFINDTNNRDKPYVGTAYTIIGKDMSAYSYMLPKESNESNSQKSMTFVSNSEQNLATENTFYDFSTNNLFVVGNFGSEFTANIDPKPTDYKISNETKVIGGYTAQKATIEWRGRKWEIWYTKELPFTTGPWKFVGLPGLILDARDQTGEYIFEYAGFDKFDQSRKLTVFRGQAKKLSYPEFIKTEQNFKNNLGSYIENSVGSGRKMIIKNQDGEEFSLDDIKAKLKKNNDELKKKNNNRIEF